ncbi:MAG TPA: sulfotransferase, partial [Chloroflexota bacterium]|nr:sulfotransferase [Chloroflexota bacterium]
MPIRVYWADSQPRVDWCYLGDERFVDPFFADTIERQLSLPFNLAFRYQTSLDDLIDLEKSHPGIPPSGFIFHMSRCGSTLVAQMLAALPTNLVVSEPEPIDGILRTRQIPGISDEQRLRWLTAMLSALARPRIGERHFFVKFDSWHIFDLALIRKAYPEVPWIFLYREPIEVMMSHRKQMGSQMIPGTLPLDILASNQRSPLDLSLEEYGARVLAAFCEAALAQRDRQGWLVNYQDLPELVWTDLASHFRLPLNSAEIKCMRVAAQTDAKSPPFPFVDDSFE